MNAAPALPQRAGGRGTMIESLDHVRDLKNSTRDSSEASQLPSPTKAATQNRQNADNTDTMEFRPINRPPTLTLCVLDDGSNDQGEWIRIRTERFVIGRVDGDLVLPHDSGLSSSHVAIVRRNNGEKYDFNLRDLNSTNGTFVRVTRAFLKKDSELLLGINRYRFDPGLMNAAAPAKSEQALSTRGWQAVTPASSDEILPALFRLLPTGEEQRMVITGNEAVFGRNPAHKLAAADDHFVDKAHARIFKDEKQRWVIEDRKSINGVWLRTKDVQLINNRQFQIGEQRFRVQIN